METYLWLTLMKMNEENVKNVSSRPAPFLAFIFIFDNHMSSPRVVSDISQPRNSRLSERACDLASCERQGKRDSTGTKRLACHPLARWPDASQGCLYLRRREDLYVLALRTSLAVRTSALWP